MHSLGLNRVIATIHPENKQSFRVAEKIGMMCIGDGDYFGEPCKLYEVKNL
jgi:RimJ/RimL family protein N-acetyltransferase